MAMSGNIGVNIVPSTANNHHAWLFGEDQARYLIAVEANSVNPILSTASGLDIPAAVIGTFGGDSISISGLTDVPLSDIRKVHEAWLPDLMGG